MDNVNDTDRAFIARCALGLFIAGLLVPFLIEVMIVTFSGSHAATDTAAPLALGFGLICEVLAFVLGIVGRRYASGKTGMIGGATTLVMVLVLVLGAAALFLHRRLEVNRAFERAQEHERQAEEAVRQRAGK
ncbi:MAG: hypothetical protein ABSG68_13245 [Thermoguttaceae bacterium]|jgi:uncharacterized membrane protein